MCNLATRKLGRMKAFDCFKNEIWCMDLAYVDKIAKDYNGVKYLLIRQDLCYRTVDAEREKTKLQRNGSCNSDYDYKKESCRKDFGRQGNRFCWSF